MKDEIERATGRRVVNARPVGGGCINEGWRAELDDGRVAFVKTRSDVPPGEYENEAAALDWLAEPRAVNVPEVLGHSGLVLAIEWVEEGRMTTEGAEAALRLAGRTHPRCLSRGLAARRRPRGARRAVATLPAARARGAVRRALRAIRGADGAPLCGLGAAVQAPQEVDAVDLVRGQ